MAESSLVITPCPADGGFVTAEKRQSVAEGGGLEKRQKLTQGINCQDLEEMFKLFEDTSTEDRSLDETESDSDDYDVPPGALKKHHKDFEELWSIYRHQASLSEGFDIDDYPGDDFGVVVPVWGNYFKDKAEIMMELAEWAIREYNEKKCNEFKYKLLKIEKANYSLGGYCQYFMTVKVLNITLGTPIETFQILAVTYVTNDNDRKIYLCRPKEEGAMARIKAIDGSFAEVDGVKCPRYC